MRIGTLIVRFPCVSWLIGFSILGISELHAVRRRYAQGSIRTLICQRPQEFFLSLESPLALGMLGEILAVEIQASAGLRHFNGPGGLDAIS